jgi:ribosomal protein S18 acetylase RimI-like enzyme
MNAAFNAQYGHFRAEDIAQTANPRSRALVHSQVVKLMSAKSEHALYLEARLDMPDEPNKVVGFSKVKFADGRSRLRRMVDTDEEDARNLADVSDTYVNPAQQGHFVGTMLLHSGLDAFPDDIGTIVYEYPSENPRVRHTLEAYQFVPGKHRSRTVGKFGHQIEQVPFLGLSVGDLRQMIEAKAPFLADRTPIQPASMS